MWLYIVASVELGTKKCLYYVLRTDQMGNWREIILSHVILTGLRIFGSLVLNEDVLFYVSLNIIIYTVLGRS